MVPRCLWCEKKLSGRPTGGRPRIYCGVACRQRAYEARKLAAQYPRATLPPILEEKRHRRLSKSDRILAWHAEREVERRVQLELLQEIARLQPDALAEWLASVRSEPTAMRLKELRKLPRVQPANDNPTKSPFPW